MDYNQLFHECAEFLRWLAPIFNMTYKEINIWIFVIIEPIVFFIMLFYIFYLRFSLYQNRANFLKILTSLRSHCK
jgi:hypothetical protein